MNLILRVHTFLALLTRRVLVTQAPLVLTGAIQGSLSRLVHGQTGSLALLASNNQDQRSLIFRVGLVAPPDFAAADFSSIDFFTA